MRVRIPLAPPNKRMIEMKIYERGINFWEQVFLISRKKGNTVENCVKESNKALEEWREMLKFIDKEFIGG